MSIRWQGSQAVFVVGTKRYDNTLKIQPNQNLKGAEELSLVLPTLCITYADMKFANSIAGLQANYPNSNVYGPRFFDPPIVITGDQNIEKLTYIRGAYKVTIGKNETTIEWPSWKELVIPRLRIEDKERIKVLLNIPSVTISKDSPISVRIQQFADGRHLGGVEIIKRHPDWKPPAEQNIYNLWIRAISGAARRAIPEARVSLYTWMNGKFVKENYMFTNAMGIAQQGGLSCSDKKMILVEADPFMPRTWRFRPLPGQTIRQTFKLWRNRRVPIPDVAQNENPIVVAAFEPIYHSDARDTLKRLAEYFCYNGERELASANKLPVDHKVSEEGAFILQGWQFLQTSKADLFAEFDKKYGLKEGWSRPAQITLHDDPTRAFEHEVVAVPTKGFADIHKLRRYP